MTCTSFSNACVPPGDSDGARRMEDLDAVMRAYSPMIFRFALGLLNDHDAAESVVQECFFKAYRAKETLRAETSLKAWLLRIARNLACDHGRDRRRRFWRQVSACPVDHEIERVARDLRKDPLQQVLANEQTAMLRVAVAKLPAKDREVFILRFGEGLAFRNISALTGLRESTARGHAFRAVRRIKSHFAQASCS